MDTSKRPISFHLQEAFIRLRRCVLYVVAAFAVGYGFSFDLVTRLEQPILAKLPPEAHLVFTAPFEKFWVYMRISLVVGVALAFPLIALELRAFLAPGLKPRERRRLYVLVCSASVVFCAGLWIGYRFVLPPLIDAILHFGSATIVPFLTLSSYMNTTLGVLLATALFLELPVVMIHLSGWGWVDPKVWSKARRISIVINAIISAILSPPDPMSMIVMMIPLQILYEGGILGARVAKWLSYDSSESATPNTQTS